MRINNINSFESDQERDNKNLKDVLEKFEFSLKCYQCGQVLENPQISSLYQHNFFCSETSREVQRSQFQYIVYEQKSQINETIFNTKTMLEQFIKIKTEQIFNNKQISKSTKKLYKNYILEFLQHIDPSKIEASDILGYLSVSKININLINSLIFLKNSLKILFNNEEKQQLITFKREAKLSVKLNPHVSWDIELIQRFIDDLVRFQKSLMAFRIFLLYKMSARVSELSQITFGQIISGKIRYLPQKQNKCGRKAERYFSVDEDTIYVVKVFMKRNNIDSAQYLNIGLGGSSVLTHSIINEFKINKKQVLQNYLTTKRDDDTYVDFLRNFKLHDIRYTSIQDIFSSEPNVDEIRQYLGHSSVKITEHYLKSTNKISDVWQKKGKEQVKAKLNKLFLQFQGEKDLIN